MRIINAHKEEKEYLKKKNGHKVDFIDLEARNSFQRNKVTASVIKSACRHNYYGLCDAMINNNMADVSCLRCFIVET